MNGDSDKPIAIPTPPPPKKKNNFVVIMILLAFIGGFLMLTFFLNPQNSVDRKTVVDKAPSEKTPLFVSRPLPSFDFGPVERWKTYINSTYGFSFRYPESTSVSESMDEIALTSDDFSQLMRVRVQNDPFTEPKKGTKHKNFTTFYPVTDVEKTEVIIANEKATNYILKCSAENCYGNFVYLNHGGSYYEINFYLADGKLTAFRDQFFSNFQFNI